LHTCCTTICAAKNSEKIDSMSLHNFFAVLCLTFVGCMTSASASENVVTEDAYLELMKVYQSLLFLDPLIAGDDSRLHAGLVSAIEDLDKSTMSDGRRAALAHLMLMTGDELSVVEEKPPIGEPTRISIARMAGGVAVVRPFGAYFIHSKENKEKWRRLAETLGQSKAVIFDFRLKHAVSAAYGRELNRLLVESGVARRLGLLRGQGPSFRSIRWEGFPNGVNDYIYSKRFVQGSSVRSFSHLKRLNGLRIAFLCNANSVMPNIAGYAREQRRGVFLSDGSECGRGLEKYRLIALSDGVKVEVRTSQRVGQNGELGYRPNAIISAAADISSAHGESAFGLAASVLAGSYRRPDRPALNNVDLNTVIGPQINPSLSRAERLAELAYVHGVLLNFHPDEGIFSEVLNEAFRTYIKKSRGRMPVAAFALELEKFVAHVPDGHVVVHSKYLRAHYGEASLPLKLASVQGEFVVSESGGCHCALRRGDVLISIGGVSIDELVHRFESITPKPTPQFLHEAIIRRLTMGKQGEVVPVRVRRASAEALTVDLHYISDDVVPGDSEKPSFSEVSPGVGYINLAKVSNEQAGFVFAALGSTKALIFDLRAYPENSGWAYVRAVLRDQNVLGAKLIVPTLNGVTGARGMKTIYQRIVSSGYRYPGQVLILVDENSVSKAEHIALLLRSASSGQIVGRVSAGVDGDVTTVCTASRLCVSFSGAAVFQPDGAKVSGSGLKPDLVVPATLSDVSEGRDRILEQAISTANSMK
jgi:hypothetical protein